MRVRLGCDPQPSAGNIDSHWIFDGLPDDQIDWSKYLPPSGFRVLPSRWLVERKFA